MQTKPRLLVNLLAKLTRIEPLMGAMGPWGAPLCQFQGQGPGNTLGERLGMGRGSAWGEARHGDETNMRLMRLMRL